MSLVSANQVPTCAPFIPTNTKYIDKTSTLKEVPGAKSSDASSVKFQEFNLLKSDFKDYNFINHQVDLKATFSTNQKVPIQASIKTTAFFSILYNNVVLSKPIASRYKYLVFKVTDVFGRSYYYDFNGKSSCQVDLPVPTTWGIQIKDVELIGGNQ